MNTEILILRVERLNELRLAPRAPPSPIFFMDIKMLKRITTDPAISSRKQDLTATQKARVEALRQAERDRAEKRLQDDARIDVNAAKWRYVSPKD